MVGKVISHSQTAFVPARQIFNGVVVVNELIDYAKRAKKECLIFKVDSEKAYDCVSWSFLRYMFDRLGFGSRWKLWMEACVF